MTAPDDTIRFLLDGAVTEIAAPDPTATLLDWLRYRARRTGAKEGCAEGDCGACTVLVGEAEGEGLAWRAVNACILFLPMLDGRALMTIEGLSGSEANPLQCTMATNGSSQCGFCTPGFVLSLHGRAIGARGSDLPVADVIAGNLCRCTGYGPILAAGEAHPPAPSDDASTLAALRALRRDVPLAGEHQGRRWYVPRDLDQLAAVLAREPEARLVAGATDVGLWVTKQLRVLSPLVFLGEIAALRELREDAAGLTIGATVRHADAHAALARLAPDLGELMRRFAGLQVRNAGTVGGNIANGSPIGDLPPALIAMGAQLTLQGPDGPRTLPLEDFFIAYGRQDRWPGEFVHSVFVPRPAADDIVHVSKLSKRFDSDISAVCGAVRLTVRDGTILAARVAFGGMAGTPTRAPACEAALTGAAFDEGTIARAAAALARDFTPLDDVRGTAAYRLEAAAAVLWRLWHRHRGTPASLLDLEPIALEPAGG